MQAVNFIVRSTHSSFIILIFSFLSLGHCRLHLAKEVSVWVKRAFCKKARKDEQESNIIVIQDPSPSPNLNYHVVQREIT